MGIIDESGIARFEVVENFEQMRALSPLLMARANEEHCLFAHANLLPHSVFDADSVSAVLDYWATASRVEVIAAYCGDHRVGLITTQVKSDMNCGQEIKVAEIITIYIIKSFRKKGIATKFLSLVSARLKKQGVRMVTSSWLIGNTASRKLYEKFHFEPLLIQAGKLVISEVGQ